MRRVDDAEVEQRAIAVIPLLAEGTVFLLSFFRFFLVQEISQSFEVDPHLWIDSENEPCVPEVSHQE